MRVHELAKKLGMKNKELIEKLQAAGIAVKTHSSGVNEAEAMAALGGAGQEADKPKTSRPRTMIRRRKPAGGAEERSPEEKPDAAVAKATEPVVDNAATEEPAPVQEVSEEPAQTEDAVASPEEPTPVAEAHSVEVSQSEAPVVEEGEQPEVAVESEPSASAKAESEDAAVEAADEKAEIVEAGAEEKATVEDPAPAGEEESAPKNVVRVIDPNAIRERLKAEGRDFTPRPKRQFSKVREIKVVNDRYGGGPRMVDVSGSSSNQAMPPSGSVQPAPGAGGGARPSKRGGSKGATKDYQDRRELRTNRDFWLNPGKKKKGGNKGKGTEITQAAAHKRVVELNGDVTVSELAHKMAVKAGQVISKLMGMGMMVTVNQTIDMETAEIVAQEFSFEVKNVTITETDLLAAKEEDQGSENLQERAPVVTVMGHVDHGKTSLLDYIRNASVVSGEAGGITQHIGAYSVDTERGSVTFLDTPGHQAFTAMRARGAELTDIVILVVAADDGVKPQTIEAINHAKDAEVPLVVALNKIDKVDAKPERVMQQLTEYGLVPEEWGGDCMMVPVSALKGEGVDQLLESVALQSEILELKAPVDRRAKGIVVEAQLDKGRGPVSTVLVQSGVLHQGDVIVAGEYSGKVRAMYNSKGVKLTEAGPSTPVQVLGLSGVPGAGDRFDAVSDEKTAKQVAEHRLHQAREAERRKTSKVTLEDFMNTASPGEEGHELRIIIKADVGGSVEALGQALRNLATKKVAINVVHSGVGTISENDINLGKASGAILIGFNVKPDAKATAIARQEKIDVRCYSVIYEAIDEVRLAMAGLLAPKLEESYLGKAEVRALFSVPKLGVIAGSYVLDGKILRSGKVRVKRDNESIFSGEISSLKRFKDDVREVASGYECGIGVQGFSELKEGDIIEVFQVKEVAAELDTALVDLEDEAPNDSSKKTVASEASASA